MEARGSIVRVGQPWRRRLALRLQFFSKLDVSNSRVRSVLRARSPASLTDELSGQPEVHEGPDLLWLIIRMFRSLKFIEGLSCNEDTNTGDDKTIPTVCLNVWFHFSDPVDDS